MKLADLSQAIAQFKKHKNCWFLQEALLAFESGWWQAIPARTSDDLYLVRFWLTPPELGDESSSSEFSFANSLMLHWFLQPDDDGALHDHPAPFRTTVLAGRYLELLPPDGWSPADPLGPEYGAKENLVTRGNSVFHQAADLHAIGRIDPHTWTLVRTGDRVRDWGFHPPGKEWQPWRQFLNLPNKVA